MCVKLWALREENFYSCRRGSVPSCSARVVLRALKKLQETNPCASFCLPFFRIEGATAGWRGAEMSQPSRMPERRGGARGVRWRVEAGGRAERQAEGSAGSREPPRRGLSLAARGPGAIVWLPAQAPVTASASWGAPRGRGAEGASGPFGESGAAGGGRDGEFARCRDVVVGSRTPTRGGVNRRFKI